MDEESGKTEPKIFRDAVVPETRAEKLLADCILSGKVANVSNFEIDDDKKVREVFLWDICVNAEARNVHPLGINLRGAQIIGELKLDDATVVRALRLTDCIFVEPLSLMRAHLKALALNRSELKKGLFAGKLELDSNLLMWETEVMGETRLSLARIRGNAEFHGAKLINPGFTADAGSDAKTEDMFALDAKRLTVDGTIFLRELGHDEKISWGRKDKNHTGDVALVIKGTADFRGASVGYLEFSREGRGQKPWPEECKVLLDGFEYEALLPTPTADWCIRWIENRPHNRYNPQPYEQAIKVYRKSGYLKEAREIGIAKEDAYGTQSELSRIHKAWLCFVKSTIAYGYKPWRALAWIFFAVMFAWMFFNSAYHNGYMRPAKERVFVHDCFNGQAAPNQCSAWIERELKWRQDPLRLPNDYPAFNAFMYSLDTFFPFVDFHQEAYWLPFAGDRFGWFFRLWLWGHIIAGWVLSTMAVAGLTGLIKKD